jgi:dipeptidyl aminopeptidase/acylaminoacyl peptidase
MLKKPRLKRFDKMGSTIDIPYTRNLFDIKRQKWIVDRFYRLMGRDALTWRNPEEAIGTALSRGNNYFDVKDTGARIKSLEALPKENTRTGIRLEKLGKREEDAGHYETACDYYYRACFFYGAAAWGIFDSDDEEFIWLTDKLRSTFDKVIKYSRYPMERVEIPFEGKSISGILSLTPNRKKAPTILSIPGMDQFFKEGNLNHMNNPFVMRGMNSLVIDGPGQGDSLVRKLWVDEGNYGRAGKAAIDYLVKRPEVDPNKIGITGISMGTYWGPLIAIHDPRVRAIATMHSCQCNKDHLFNEESPNFRSRFMWMAGNLSDEELDKMAAKMTLEGRESEIKCPHIIFHGEFDHLTTTEEIYRYFNNLGSEVKELRIYESQYHGPVRFTDELVNMSADWLRDRLNGVPPKENRRIVLVDWNKKEHPVDEDKIAKGFLYFSADES